VVIGSAFIDKNVLKTLAGALDHWFNPG